MDNRPSSPIINVDARKPRQRPHSRGQHDEENLDLTSEAGTSHVVLSTAGPPTRNPTDQPTNQYDSGDSGSVPPQFLMEMMKMMQQMTDRLAASQETRVKITDIFLPTYDPDGSIGIREWCDHISTAKDHYKLKDYEVQMKATSLLKGRAKLWADKWLVTTTSWSELQENLITTFEPESRYSRDIVKFKEHTYDSNSDIVEFLSTAWILWRRVTKDKLCQEDAVEAVIGSVADEKLRIELMNARAHSVPELISVAASIRSRKRSHGNYNTQPSQKRSRFTSNSDVKSNSFCTKCKKRGHSLEICYFNTQSRSNSQYSRPKYNHESLKPICTYCSTEGHTIEKCFKRNTDLSSKRVNNIGRPKLSTIVVKLSNLTLHALFDSGADCSVIRESIAAKIPGRRKDVVTYLKGVGSASVMSLQTVQSTCLIDNIHVEIKFCVLPDHELSFDVLLGTNLLEQTGLSVVVTHGGAKLIRSNIMHTITLPPLFENLDCDLTDSTEIKQLLALLNKFSHMFTQGFGKTRVTTGELEIRLKNPEKYVERRPYRLNSIERVKVKNILKDLLDHKIIQESKSPFSSPVILVKKKNGTDRMCVDYRELNSNTVRDHYPLPLIADQIDQLSKSRFFTTLDMASGFHQIPVSKDSIEKTAFITPDGLYEFLTMPFGLCNAPAVYQRCINRALEGLIGDSAQVYIDDVLCKSTNFEEGLLNLEKILIALHKSGFSINVNKCSFFKKSVEYLGNVISEGQVRPSPRKVEALTKSPIPTTIKQVRQFNGLAGYFRKFIPNFSRIMIPLYALTKKNAKFSWTYDHESARNTIIDFLTAEPVLTIFREEAPIELYTDASSLGYGAVFVQVINNRQHAVAYMSMRTTDAESRYHSYELETLAVVRAIKHFRHFLYGRKFKLITDCNSLKASKHKQDLLPRIHRWWAFLQHFDFDVEYRKGDRLQHADFFSRNPIPAELSVNVMTRDLEWLKVEQRRDPSLKPIFDQLKEEKCVPDFFIDNEVLKKRITDPILGHQNLTVVPTAFQYSLINVYHNSLKHVGWEKTLQKIKESYWFQKMNSIIRTFVDNCIVCKTSKSCSGQIQVRLHPIPKPTTAFEVIHMDVTGKLGTQTEQQYVIVTIDAFSKYVLLYHANDKSHHSTLAALKQVIHLFGAPRQVVVDGGREFLGEYKKYCDNFGIAIHAISPGISRANGQVERVMSILKNGLVMIRNYDTPEWHTALGGLQLAFNCTVHRTTGISPLTLLTRRQHCVPSELINLVNIDEHSINFEKLDQHVQKRTTEYAAKAKQRFDHGKARIHHFSRGDYVMIKNNPRNQTSLDLKFSEPYEIYKILDKDRYLVKRVSGKGRPRKVAHDQLRKAPNPGEQMAVSSMNNCEDNNATITDSSVSADQL